MRAARLRSPDLGGAGALALLMLAWLAVSGATAGGIVLGLILLLALAGPLAVAGVVVLRRQPGEAEAGKAFANTRRVLDADRVFRDELAPELRQLAHLPGLPGARLEDMVAGLERSTHDSADWYDTVQLGDDDVVALKRYDNLVWDRVRLLRDRAGQLSGTQLSQAINELQQALDQRHDLLVRGVRAPTAAPSVLLRAGAPSRDLDAIRNLGLADAVSSAGTDYLVEGVATYFAEGQTGKLVHLSPAAAGLAARWLYIGPAGLELAILDELQLAPTEATLRVNGSALQHVASGSATVDVVSQAGSARGVLVEVRRYAAGTAMGLVEQWPDGNHHMYAGTFIHVADLEVWPAANPARGLVQP